MMLVSKGILQKVLEIELNGPEKIWYAVYRKPDTWECMLGMEGIEYQIHQTEKLQERKIETKEQGETIMAGKLYLCATPIGNLEDITYRVLRTLKEVDLIAAEDTRNSIKLLNHFEIKTPMTSYHEFNKIDKAYTLVDKLREGKNIALITDAGTPGISDPGEDLVRICYEEGIDIRSGTGGMHHGAYNVRACYEEVRI